MNSANDKWTKQKYRMMPKQVSINPSSIVDSTFNWPTLKGCDRSISKQNIFVNPTFELPCLLAMSSPNKWGHSVQNQIYLEKIMYWCNSKIVYKFVTTTITNILHNHHLQWKVVNIYIILCKKLTCASLQSAYQLSPSGVALKSDVYEYWLRYGNWVWYHFRRLHLIFS